MITLWIQLIVWLLKNKACLVWLLIFFTSKCRLGWLVKACTSKLRNCQNKIYSLFRKIRAVSNYILILAFNNMNDKSCVSTGVYFYCGFLTFFTLLYICSTYFWENVTRNRFLFVALENLFAWQAWSWKISQNLKVFAWLEQYCTFCD